MLDSCWWLVTICFLFIAILGSNSFSSIHPLLFWLQSTTKNSTTLSPSSLWSILIPHASNSSIQLVMEFSLLEVWEPYNHFIKVIEEKGFLFSFIFNLFSVLLPLTLLLLLQIHAWRWNNGTTSTTLAKSQIHVVCSLPHWAF